jgi:hypothetical protein
LSQLAGAEVFDRLANLLLRIHHEGAILGDRLIQRAADDQVLDAARLGDGV